MTKRIMNRLIESLTPPVFLSMVCLLFPLSVSAEPYNGFNFYGNGVSLSNKSCRLVDMKGKVLHEWKSTYPLNDKCYLLRDSSVLWPGMDNADVGNGKFPATGVLEYLSGGRFQIIKWDGTIVWDFPYHGAKFIPHHDCFPVYYTNDPTELPHVFALVYSLERGDTISEKIVEIKPTGKTTGEIVWQWDAWDHITDNGTDKPELLDVRKGWTSGFGKKEGMGAVKEWLHANYVRYNPILDQVMICVKAFNEIMIIDHSTTTAQAAGHSGGKYGKGGDILYRWGNPKNYGATGAQILKGQHAACWIPSYMPGTRKPLPGAGNILVVSNENQKGYEIVPDHKNGVYSRTAGKAYGPENPLRTFPLPLLEINEGTLQRLPNGNTFLCNARTSKGSSKSPGLEEYDSTWKSVWQLDTVTAYQCFRYDSAYLGSTVLETEGKSGLVIDALPENAGAPWIQCGAANGIVRIAFFNRDAKNAVVSLYSPSGRAIVRSPVTGGELRFNMGNNAFGVYMVKARWKDKTVIGRFSLVRQ